MAGKMKKVYSSSLLTKMESNVAIAAMRDGVLLTIPFLLVGSFCIVLTSLPLDSYQVWIRTVLDGILYQIIMWLYNATMGSISLVLILGISYSYGQQKKLEGKEELAFYMLTSISAYIVFAAESIEQISLSIFDSTWMFTAIIITLSSCRLLEGFSQCYSRFRKQSQGNSVDKDFKSTMYAIAPIVSTLLIIALVKLFFLTVAGNNVQNIGTKLSLALFEKVGTGLAGSILFIFLIHIMWFFGIHGSNMLSSVSDNMFEAGMIENIQLVANGGEAVHIFTKTFFDVFVLMGGSGATLCLLTALLFSKKNTTDRKLFGLSIIPSLFNINEIVMFGLPVIFNPVMIVPFILVPMLTFFTSATAMTIGLVPIPHTQVSWTTPVFLSGYLSTGSWRAVLLQLFNIAFGSYVYIRFMKLANHYYDSLLERNIENLKKDMIAAEEKGEQVNLKTYGKGLHETVKVLTKDLRKAIVENEIRLFYQPQVRSDNTVYGVEALLRWEHPIAGFIYPPMIIEIAREDGILDELGIIIIDKASKTLEYLAKKAKHPIHMAVNISPVQFENPLFCERVKYILNKYDFMECTLCFEVTEQMALSSSRIVSERINELKQAGIPFHMDDFGMGHSSMKYLQSNEFEALKLDGSLIRQMMQNERSQNIISGIQQMATPLNYELIAEYVETEEQKEALRKLGCQIYQGTLYSWPIPLEELEKFLKLHNAF